MEFSDYMRFVIALAFVLALIGALHWAVKRYGVGGRSTVSRGKSARRLQIVEILPVDSRRRAVLLRRDDTEHLVLLGSNGELVIETDIKPPPGQHSNPDQGTGGPS
jgi:flagellar protein FliO/FliZ